MASEEITNETAEQPVEAATPAPVAETPAAAVSAPEEIKKPGTPQGHLCGTWSGRR